MTEKVPYIFRGVELPEELRESIDAYVEHGRQPGDFLTACIENNLASAFGHADEKSLAAMAAVVGYLYNECPGPCWGKNGKVKEWIEQVRKEREA